MFMSIMYHHVCSDRCSNDIEIFEKHLEYISRNFVTLFPGEKVVDNSLCLTFDDAYADFYLLIFPLLKKYNLKALLAVPSQYILDDTNLDPKIRLGFEHNDLFTNYDKATFCTKKELLEMIDSKLVVIGSHSHSHINLLESSVDVEFELSHSKKILEEMLGVNVDSFVFPFGKYNQSILDLTLQYYKYPFRIGNAIHKDFGGINGVIYRVKGDDLKTPNEIFTPLKIVQYRFKGFIKRVARD